MKAEVILLAAQKEKELRKEFENKASIKSNLFGSLIALIVGIFLFTLEYCISNSVNVGLVAVGMTASGAQLLFEGIKVKRAYMIVIGIVLSLVALFAMRKMDT